MTTTETLGDLAVGKDHLEEVHDFFEDPTAQHPDPAKSHVFRLDEMTAFTGHVGKDEVEAYGTLRSGRLNRVSLLMQQPVAEGDAPPKSPYWIGTTVLNDVKLDLVIMRNGREVPVHEFLRNYVNSKITDETMHYSEDRFNSILRDTYGSNMAGRQTMFTQHLGSDRSKVEAAQQYIANQGGYNDVERRPNQNWNRIQSAWVVPEDVYIPVTSISVGSMTRELSQVYKIDGKGQGFTDFIDAMTGVFFSGLTDLMSAQKLQQELVTRLDAGDKTLKEKEIRDTRALISQIKTRAGTNRRTWGGVQSRYVRDENTNVLKNTGDPVAVNVPVGQLTVGEEPETTLNFWRPRATEDGGEAQAPEAVVDTADPEDMAAEAMEALSTSEQLDEEDERAF